MSGEAAQVAPAHTQRMTAAAPRGRGLDQEHQVTELREQQRW